MQQRSLLEEEKQTLLTDQADAKAENPRLEKEGKELGERIRQLEGAPDCPLCGQPLSPSEGKTLIESLTNKQEDLRERYRVNLETLRNFESELRSLGSRLANLSSLEADLRQATRQADQITSELKGLEERQKAWAENGADD